MDKNTTDFIGDLAALAVPLGFFSIFVFFGYFDYRSKKRRLEVLHQERMAAIEKGIPLPELPELEPPPRPAAPKGDYPNAALLTGIILLCAGVGGIGGFILSPPLQKYFSLPLPLVLVGFGLVLYHYLTNKRAD
jgi:hypothetical protein